MNAPLSKLVGDIIDAIAEQDDEGAISDSTEDMVARIRAANVELQKEENKKWTSGPQSLSLCHKCQAYIERCNEAD